MARKLKAVNIEIGARIKNERTAQKMTREDLAKLSGYSANFIQEVDYPLNPSARLLRPSIFLRTPYCLEGFQTILNMSYRN